MTADLASRLPRDCNPRTSQESFLAALGLELRTELERIPDVLGAFYAGSAANRELMMATSERDQPLGDVELGFVMKRPWRRAAVRAIAVALSHRHGVDVDAFLVTPRRLRLGSHRNLTLSPRSATVFAYEIGAAADWLYARGHLEVRRWTPSDVHPWEGARAILNRLGEGAPWLGDSRERTWASIEYRRWLVKALVATGDAMLLASGRFAPSYRARRDLWLTYGETLAPDSDVRTAIHDAYVARTEAMTPGFGVPGETWVAALRSGMSAALESAAGPWPGPVHAASFRSWLATAGLPDLHGGGGSRFSVAFDNLLRLPRIRPRRLRAARILADWRGRGCLQHWAYAPLAAAILTAASPSALYAEAAEGVTGYLRGPAPSHRATVRTWWDWMCK